VQSHAHSDRSVGERFARRRRRSQRVGRLRERDEERITSCLHLDATVPCERLAQRATVLGKHLDILVAELLQQPRRTFDVREQEGDRARR
jgi:hypothetical protein